MPDLLTSSTLVFIATNARTIVYHLACKFRSGVAPGCNQHLRCEIMELGEAEARELRLCGMCKRLFEEEEDEKSP